MSPSTKYLTAYEKECIRKTGETWIRITLEEGRANLTPEAERVKNDLVAKVGIRQLCRYIRVALEDTKSRDMNRVLIEIGEIQEAIAGLSPPKK